MTEAKSSSTCSFNLGQVFDCVVNQNRETVAVRTTDRESVTYGALQNRTRQFVGQLLNRGVRSGDVVAIVHDKSVDAFAMMLACLKAGVIYTNLDPDSPWTRVRRILNVCRPVLACLFSDECPLRDSLEESELCVWSVSPADRRDDLGQWGTDEDLARSIEGVSGSHPAYIMFTSGSTGTPKGVVISHSNVMNFIDWARSEFRIGPGDVLTNLNPMYFDNSVFDFYGSLFSGATLLPVIPEDVRSPQRLVRIINEHLATVWFSVPSLLVYLLTTRALSRHDFGSLRKIVFGGEGFPKSKLKQLFDLYGDRIDLENVYGPTECTCICSAHRVRLSDFDDMVSLTTLGQLAPNFQYQILPQEDDPDFGELFLRGPQVGLGYFADPGRTSQQFAQNPLHVNYRDIGYRTGDLVLRDECDNLHFRGRVDFQVKHMGYRIELEEIEAALNSIGGVEEGAVIYRRIADGMGRIEAFLVAGTNGCANVLEQLRTQLPSYMLPQRLHQLTRLPRNANGKIDRRRLEDLQHARAAG